MVDLSLLQDFLAETVEYLEEMEESLLRMKADPGNRTILDDIFRSVHTIKGAAEYLGIERISELSRTIEDLLYHQLHRNDIKVSPEVIDLLSAGRERIRQLTENLAQTQEEQVEIDDLIESIRVVDTTSHISEEVDRMAAEKDKPEIAAVNSDQTANLEDDEDEETDEELFTIFLEQMEENLNALQSQITVLVNSDKDEQAAALDVCLTRIEPLRASANYMGYRQLTTFYENWKERIQEVKEEVLTDKRGVITPFIEECMESNLAALISRFPRLKISEPSTRPISDTSASAESEDHSASDDFPDILSGSPPDDGKTKDILDEYADPGTLDEASDALVSREKSAADAGLFEQLSWSFDSRIKQNAAKTSTENLTEIESELFSDSAPASVEPGATAPETLIAPVEISATHEDTYATEDEELTVAIKTESPITDDFEEENDAELFTIFKEQLKEELSLLQTQIEALKKADKSTRIELLNSCREKIDRLASSANYMGYVQLNAFYETWLTEISVAETRLKNQEEGFLPDFLKECMQAHISSILKIFPEITLSIPEPEVGDPACKMEDEISATSTDTAAEIETAEKPDRLNDKEAETGDRLETEQQLSITDLSMLPDFINETREHLEEMEENLLLLDANSGKRETLDDVFRSVHTIKGAAEYLGVERIAKLTHNLENLLYQLRQNKLNVSREITALIMEAWDRISLLTDDLEQNQSEQALIDDLLERILTVSGAEQTPQLTAEEALKRENTALLQGSDRRESNQNPRRQSDQSGEKTIKQSIRVDAGKIDALMNQVGELVVSRAGFAQLLNEMRGLQLDLKQRFKLDTREIRHLNSMTARLHEATTLFDKVTNELQEEVMKVRMLPISQLFNRYPRLVFDLVRDTGKQVQLDIHGADTELDKMVIEEISDPLIHIIRNAVDHGIETTSERLKKGKPETGTIKLEAYHEGNHVVIEITDDGRGLDIEQIKEKALAGKFVSRGELEQMSTQEITGLIMKPGFSTAATVTHISGRGVGMDVVKKNLEKLNGTIEIDTTPGIAMRIRIKIPLTLAIIPALRVKVGSGLFTIPLSTVEETLRVDPEQISTIEGAKVMSFRENTLPLVNMSDLFNLQEGSVDLEHSFVVVVSTGMKRMGLVVDDLLGQEEVVIKPLADYIQEKSGFSGATILGDGRISLILDVYELINLSIKRNLKK